MQLALSPQADNSLNAQIITHMRKCSQMHMLIKIVVERYADFHQMEYMPEIASALDIYADEMTTSHQI